MAATHTANVISERTKWFLKEWRKHRGLSQEALAERIGTSKGYISDFETGKRRYNQDFLELAAEVLQCEPADLLRRAPGDTQGIETTGLEPDQIKLVEGMVEDMRRRAG